jgi:hypothetical protein
MNTLKKQQGLTLLAWILVLIVLSFALLCAFKIIPLYAENRYVVSALRALVDPGTNLEDMTDAEIKRKLSNFYTINNVRGQGPSNIVIKREAKKVVVTIDYEGRTTLFENAPLVRTLDVVVKFENHLDSTLPDRCCTPISQ